MTTYNRHPTGMRPKRVELLCLGNSLGTWLQMQLRKGAPHRGKVTGASEAYDERWTVNRGVKAIADVDLCFVLDDLHGEEAGDPDYVEWLKGDPHEGPPVMTSTVYDDYPRAFAYPLRDVCEMLGTEHYYLDNSVPMVIAYAVLIGVEELTIFGADYASGDGAVMEANRANCEYMIAWARLNGCRVGVPTGSSLLNNHRPHPRIYGYRTPPRALGHWLRTGEWPDDPKPTPFSDLVDDMAARVQKVEDWAGSVVDRCLWVGPQGTWCGADARPGHLHCERHAREHRQRVLGLCCAEEEGEQCPWPIAHEDTFYCPEHGGLEAARTSAK